MGERREMREQTQPAPTAEGSLARIKHMNEGLLDAASPCGDIRDELTLLSPMQLLS